MSLAEIEAELAKMTAEELRHLALKSWSAFVEREADAGAANECDEENPQVLAALDDAIDRANSQPLSGYSGNEVRSRLSKWTSK